MGKHRWSLCVHYFPRASTIFITVYPFRVGNVKTDATRQTQNLRPRQTLGLDRKRPQPYEVYTGERLHFIGVEFHGGETFF